MTVNKSILYICDSRVQPMFSSIEHSVILENDWCDIIQVNNPKLQKIKNTYKILHWAAF